ncbi:hypothetical protein LPB140_02915 [Sphingorhabdus lutea]|uniref:Thioesterase domain-containing protein n=1 Tax=Sphingorhabdus lutea TaxID=1913578 RepID=A0A1L3JA06_9SPHN|nr:PaaI family thioesterase [Sphingorhabdus lutea]APG61949.1 hypothetical protein LPB140_02915 [Sphingorhabdus lutea]
MEQSGDEPHFLSHKVAAEPGWYSWDMVDKDRYNQFLAPIRIKMGQDGIALVRMTPRIEHSNLGNMVHGGALLGFIDVALFAGCAIYRVGREGPSLTVDLQTIFIGAGKLDRDLFAKVEIMRETGRMIFIRGTIVQSDEDAAVGNGEIDEDKLTYLVASFSGIIKKTKAIWTDPA